MTGLDASPRQASAPTRPLSVVVVNFNGMATVLGTIASILELDGVTPEIVVVDDGSTDGSPDAIRQRFPAVRVFEESRNTRQVNRLRNKGLALARSDTVLLTDNDTKFDPRCVAEMLRVMDADDSVAVCLPRLMHLDDSSRLFHAGGRVHYVGATIATRRLSEALRQRGPEIAVGGGIALFDRTALQRVGGFDEEYALAWGDDGELHQRFLLAGFKSLYVPTALCLHEFKPFDRSRHYRARGQLRNRWRFVLTHYAVRTLVVVGPALLLYEVVQALFYLANGIPVLYLQGTRDALRDLPATLRRRKAVQALRAVPDRDILFTGALYVRPSAGPAATLVSAAVGALSHVLTAYWSLVRPLLARPSRSARSSTVSATPV